MKTVSRLSYISLWCLTFGLRLGWSAANSTADLRDAPTSFRTMNFRSLPTDASSHSRHKWSADLFIVVDDDLGAPSLYAFDRSGTKTFDAMILLSGADRVRIDDFSAAPDGSIWVCGHAFSSAGQRSSFIADGQPIRVIRTDPYAPQYLTAAPDCTIWTVGVATGPSRKADLTQDSLRHFDSSGRQIASGFPAKTLGFPSFLNGFLDFNQGNLVWRSPSNGVAAKDATEMYRELSPKDLTVVHSYPTAARTNTNFALNAAVTASGRVFVQMWHIPTQSFDLLELDRRSGQWVSKEGPNNQSLQRSDGESLVFATNTSNDKSTFKLQVKDLSVTH